MLMAQLRGKLPSDLWERSEDLLTSAIFGTIKNLPESVACDLLANSWPLEGDEVPRLRPPITWHFWPWWDTCEPDVVVEDSRNICVIEAKLFAEFGGDDGVGTQLARQWRDGLKRAEIKAKKLWLVAVTNHASPPAEAIRAQLSSEGRDTGAVSWLSWSQIGRFLKELNLWEARGWCADLLELLNRMALGPFDGFSQTIRAARHLPAIPMLSEEFVPHGHVHAPGFGATIRMAASLPREQVGWVSPQVLSDVGFLPTIRASRQVGQWRWHWNQ